MSGKDKGDGISEFEAKRFGRKGATDPHGQIGRKLRTLFDQAAQEPIPTRLIDLLEQLDQIEEKDKSSSSGSGDRS